MSTTIIKIRLRTPFIYFTMNGDRSLLNIHKLLSCGVFLVKFKPFGLILSQTIMAKLAISFSGWLGRFSNMKYLQSLYLKDEDN